MTHVTYLVRRAEASDVSQVTDVAAQAWRDTYADLLRPETIDAFVSASYFPERVRERIEEHHRARHRRSSAGHAFVKKSCSFAAGALPCLAPQIGGGAQPGTARALMRRFWRAPNAPPGGTGLGLAIADWIATSHGGRIRVANRANAGAVFSVALPAS